MAQTQQQRLQMILAPQLRQSLELLQASMLELRSMIQQEIEQNPTLEEKVPDSERIEVEPASAEEPAPAADWDEEYAALAKLDDEWKDYFRASASNAGHSQDDEARRQFYMDSISQTESLQEHLLRQLSLSGMSEREQQIGELLIGNIDEDGYLAAEPADLAATTSFTLAEIETVLTLIREFDPIGVGSRNLRECLLCQMHRAGKEGALAERIIQGHLEDLGAKRFSQIAKALDATPDEIQQAAHYISTLEPNPGRRFSDEQSPYVMPEVFVQKVNGKYVVVVNDDNLPHLRISKQYRSLMDNPATTQEVKQYIQDKIRAGAFMIKSIHQRQQTIRNIAQEIVRVQEEFLDKGVAYLRPLIMNEVASVLGIHETTVSRAVANKYMQTPQGVYEMKYFFTPGYKTEGGQSVSNKTIKDRIAVMIAREDATSPLSDQALADALKDDGVSVARRTVTKYREELKILPSHLRKQR
jgi:RNA polymerase sigma-54 factor